MRHFLVFCAPHYYPIGGWDDLVEQCDTMEEVEECLKERFDPEHMWYQVVNTYTGKLVADTELKKRLSKLNDY